MLELRHVHVCRGPSVWARRPAIRLEVATGEPDRQPPNALRGLPDRLVSALPSLADDPCSAGEPGGFLERAREGTSLAHVLEHVALALQRVVGAAVSLGKTRSTGAPGVYQVVYEYRQEDVGVGAGRLACRFLNHLLSGSEPGFDLPHEIEQLIRLTERLAYGPSTGAIVEEAERRGIPVLRLDPELSLVQLGHGCHQKRIWATVTSDTPEIAVNIAHNKALTNRLLRRAGVPSPRGTAARSADEAVAAAAGIGYPVVVKPLDGNHGRGVVTDLRTEDDVRRAFALAVAESKDGAVLVERHLTGRDYRVLVIDGEVVAVAERVPAHVVGDGVHTVAELVGITNADPRRGLGHEKILTRITVDRQSRDLLACQGLTMESVPPSGAVVQLKQAGNLSTGGTSIDRTDEIHPDNAGVARLAARVIGLDIAGIDIICPDISRSMREVGGGVVEVNAGPGFRMHTHPTVGTPRPVARAVVRRMFPLGAPARIPIIAVTGTNGKTTTARMVAHIMQARGHTVGLTTTDGIYIDGELIEAGDMAGPQSAQQVLQDPRVEVAVLETARGGILRTGLGFDRCNVGVVTNVSSDHLGLRGVHSLADLARVKRVVPQSVFQDGASVLNADNVWTARMAEEARGEILFFSMDEESPVVQEHLRGQGRALVLRASPEGEMLTLLEPHREVPIMLAHAIPATAGGHLRVNIANALAAAAAALGAGVTVEEIRDALATFGNDFAQTPGRLNMLTVRGRQVIMDYGHNVGALAAIGEVVERMAPPQAIGVITMPGDRREEDMRAFGELAGRIFDRVVIREDHDRRGRRPGDIAALLREAVLASGGPPDRVSVVLDELDATRTAVELAAPGDLVVVLADRIDVVWDALRAEAGRIGAPTTESMVSSAAIPGGVGATAHPF